MPDFLTESPDQRKRMRFTLPVVTAYCVLVEFRSAVAQNPLRRRPAGRQVAATADVWMGTYAEQAGRKTVSSWHVELRPSDV